MKNLKQLKYSLAILSAIVLFACGSSPKNKEDQVSSDEEKHEVVELSTTKSKTVTKLIDTYLALKEALVHDDGEAGRTVAADLNAVATEIEPSNFEDGVQVELKELLSSLKQITEKMSNVDIKQQRALFEGMTKDFRSILTLVGSDRDLYLQYCPMYNSNQGGYWLSDQSAIYNPLFGSTMLRCGVVKLELTTQKK